MLRLIRFGKHGLAEDPRGQIVTWKAGDRTYLASVVGTYRREFPAAVMLQTRFFCGDDAPDVAASAVRLVLPDPDDCPCPATGHYDDCSVAKATPCDYCGARRGQTCNPDCAYYFGAGE